MMEKTFEDLVREEAYRIWKWRKSSWIFDYGRIGDAQGDWYQAEKIVETRRRAETVGISSYNRLERYF